MQAGRPIKHRPQRALAKSENCPGASPDDITRTQEKAGWLVGPGKILQHTLFSGLNRS